MESTPPVVAAPLPRLSRRIVAAVSVTGFGSVFAMLFNTLAGMAVAHNTGPAGYAVYVAANMLVFVSSALCDCGLSVALAKYVAGAEEHGRHEDVRGASTTMQGLMLCIGLVVGGAVSLNLPRLEQQLLGPDVAIGSGFAIAFPVVLMLTLIGYCASGIYHGLLRPRSDVIIWVAGPPAMLCYILVRRAGVPLPIWGAIATSYGCSGLVAAYQLWRDRLLGRPLPWRAMRPVFHDLPPALTFTFFTVFSAWSDRWVVGSQLGALPLGLYAAAVAVIQAALRVPTSIAYTIVPAAAKAAIGGSAASARLNRAAVSAFGWFSVLVIIIILLAAPVIIRILFGPGFLPATTALYCMTPTLLAAAISYPFMSALTGSTRNYRLLLALGLTVPARLLLLFWFTRHSYVTGTALATGLADALLALYCVLLGRRAGIVLPVSALLPPCAMGLLAYAAGAGALWLGAPAPLAAVLGVAVFTPPLLRAARAFRASVW